MNNQSVNLWDSVPRLPLSYWGLLCLAFYLAAIPVRMYSANQAEIDVPLVTVLTVSIVLFSGVALFLFGLCALFRISPNGLFTKTVVLGFVLLFVYDNLLFPLVPELDGQTPATTSPLFIALDIVILGAFLIGLRLLPNLRGDYVAAFLLFCFAMSTLGMVFALAKDPPPPFAEKPGRFEQLPLSKDLNVIHVLMDALQATEFPAGLESLDDKNAYAGFTWFKNTVGASYRTLYSLPAIFTGEISTDVTQLSDFYRSGSPTFVDVMISNDFDTYAFNWVQNSPLPKRIRGTKIKNLLKDKPSTSENIGQLLDVSLIRIVPFFLKDVFLNGYEYFIASFFRQGAPVGNEIHRAGFVAFTDGLYVDQRADAKPKYYFMHLLYPHAPYTNRSDCSYAGHILEPTPDQAKLERRCSVEAFTYLLGRLRELGVYDNTLIVLHSDTGEKYLIKADTLQGSDLPQRVIGGSPFAFLAVKPVGAIHALKVSEKPASIQDIANTVLGQLQLPKDYDGFDLFEPGDLSGRERIYWAEEQGTFAVIGDLYEPASWRKISDYRPPQAPEIKVGDRFGFDVTSIQGMGIFKNGWSTLQRSGVYATSSSSLVKLPLEDTGGQDVSILTIRGHVGNGGRRPKSYAWNGGLVKPITLSFPDPKKPGVFEFSIMVDTIPDSRELTLTITSTRKPDEKETDSSNRYLIYSMDVN